VRHVKASDTSVAVAAVRRYHRRSSGSCCTYNTAEESVDWRRPEEKTTQKQRRRRRHEGYTEEYACSSAPAPATSAPRNVHERCFALHRNAPVKPDPSPSCSSARLLFTFVSTSRFPSARRCEPAHDGGASVRRLVMPRAAQLGRVSSARNAVSAMRAASAGGRVPIVPAPLRRVDLFIVSKARSSNFAFLWPPAVMQ